MTLRRMSAPAAGETRRQEARIAALFARADDEVSPRKVRPGGQGFAFQQPVGSPDLSMLPRGGTVGRSRSTSPPVLSFVLAVLLVTLLAMLPAGCGSDEPSADDGGTVQTGETIGETDTGSDASADSSAPGDTSENGSSDNEAPDSNAPDTLELTAEDNEGNYAVKEGGTISLALKENPSTGYLWELELDDPEASLLEQSQEPAFESDNPDAVGAGGITTFTFVAVDRGEMVVRMVNIPPEGGEPADVFEITLTVI